MARILPAPMNQNFSQKGIPRESEFNAFGIICISKENLNAPWIRFEAGALAKSLQNGKVIPVLLDLELKDLSGPLAQFQAKKSEQIGIKELVVSLNKSSSSPVPELNLDKLFGMAWPELEKQIQSIPKSSAVTKSARSESDVLEELVASVRNVEMRVRESSDDFPKSRRRKMKMHPELMHMLLERPNDPLKYVMGFSFVKEEMPWMYELAVDAYRASRSGSRQRAAVARQALYESFQAIKRGPFLEMLLEDKWSYRFIHEMEHMLERERDSQDDIFGVADIKTNNPDTDI